MTLRLFRKHDHHHHHASQASQTVDPGTSSRQMESRQ
jgi:hypothetical protein